MRRPDVKGHVRREYRLVIRRNGDFPDDVHLLSNMRNAYNYARNLKRYWQSRPFADVAAEVQVREVSRWRPL